MSSYMPYYSKHEKSAQFRQDLGSTAQEEMQCDRGMCIHHPRAGRHGVQNSPCLGGARKNADGIHPGRRPHPPQKGRIYFPGPA